MTHPPPGKYLSIAANQRVKREDEKAASPDPLPSACRCLLSEHCDRTRPGCRLKAGATINQGGGICGPYAQSRADPLPSAHPRAAQIAREFHEVYEALAPYVGYRTREASAVPWEDVPSDNKRLMEATVTTLLNRGAIR